VAVSRGEFKSLALSDILQEKKWVVLLFYPMDFTFVCPTEILSFNDSLSEFEKLNAKVIAVSTDTEHVEH
jgi:alkyl hydroperoxide reductase subunit AhpC